MITRYILLFIIFSNITSNLSAQDFKLPDLGTPSDAALSPTKEAEIREQIVQQIYQFDLAIFDPFISDYIKQLGYRISSKSSKPEESFDFYVINQNAINASTYPGGLIIFFSGLFLETESESELAAVMAHEVAHATQRHISRAYENIKKNTIPTILGMVGAALAAQHSDSNDAPIAIATATMALQQQSLINFTRANEYEADRVGIQYLNKAGFNPEGMAGFFEKLMRRNPVDQRFVTNEYLRTHPLSVNRVSEAKSRIKNLEKNVINETLSYDYIKERLRNLTKNNELENFNYYQELFNETPFEQITDAQIYGYAFSLYQANKSQQALTRLSQIREPTKNHLMIKVLEANIHSYLDWDTSKEKFSNLLSLYPENPKVIIPYINALTRTNDPNYNKKARYYARQLILNHPENPNYHQLLAIVNQNAGKTTEANEALAMKEHLINNNYRAVRILKNVLKDDLDYYQRARIESRISEFQALITKEERRRERLNDRVNRNY